MISLTIRSYEGETDLQSLNERSNIHAVKGVSITGKKEGKTMATMGKYCKAYSLKKLRQFNQWTEHSENTRKEKQQVDGQEVEINRELTDDDFIYLQENYVVTDGIFQDENIIFDNVTPEWQEFCKNTLLFEIPIYQN